LRWLVVSKPEHAERLAKYGREGFDNAFYDTEDLAPGKKMISLARA